MPKLNFESKQEIQSASNNNSTFQPVVKNLFIKTDKRGCEWPVGHPDEMDFHFCGKDRFEDKPYCLDHCAVAYVVPEKEENERPQISSKI